MSQIPINNPLAPRKGERVMASDIAQLWDSVKRLSNQKEYEAGASFPPSKLPPLWITLIRKSGGTDYVVWAKFGHVAIYHNASTETGTPVEITGIPPKDTPVAAVLDDKFWVKLTIDVSGRCTAAEWEKGASWPDHVPPSLIGGDDQLGTPGTRHIRIGEIIEDPDSITTPPRVIIKQLHCGNIEYSQPELVENTTTSPSGNEARVLKSWNASAGKWELRYLEAGGALEIEELATSIRISGGSYHPWRVKTGVDANTWQVVGGTVWSYLNEIVVADLTVTGASGWVLLKITRDTASREMTAAVVILSATVPDSDYTDEYRALAYVDSAATPKVIQYQFEEIRIFEDLAVVNGEFRLVGLEMSHRNFYEPPPP